MFGVAKRDVLAYDKDNNGSVVSASRNRFFNAANLVQKRVNCQSLPIIAYQALESYPGASDTLPFSMHQLTRQHCKWTVTHWGTGTRNVRLSLYNDYRIKSLLSFS